MLGDDTTQTYQECMVTRYVFPKLAAGGSGTLVEEVFVKPLLVELDVATLGIQSS